MVVTWRSLRLVAVMAGSITCATWTPPADATEASSTMCYVQVPPVASECFSQALVLCQTGGCDRVQCLASGVPFGDPIACHPRPHPVEQFLGTDADSQRP